MNDDDFHDNDGNGSDDDDENKFKALTKSERYVTTEEIILQVLSSFVEQNVRECELCLPSRTVSFGSPRTNGKRIDLKLCSTLG